MKKIKTKGWSSILDRSDLDNETKTLLKNGIVTHFDYGDETNPDEHILNVTVRVPNKKDTNLLDRYLTDMPAYSLIITVTD